MLGYNNKHFHIIKVELLSIDWPSYVPLIIVTSILYVFIIFHQDNIFDGSVFYEDDLLNTSQILMVWEFFIII